MRERLAVVVPASVVVSAAITITVDGTGEALSKAVKTLGLPQGILLDQVSLELRTNQPAAAAAATATATATRVGMLIITPTSTSTASAIATE